MDLYLLKSKKPHSTTFFCYNTITSLICKDYKHMFNIQSWSKEFFQNATEPMSDQNSKLFLKMVLLESSSNFITPEQIQNEFMYKIIDTRAKFIGLNLSEPVKIFLMFLTKSPGSSIMYLYALRSKVDKVDMRIFSEMFPMGFLSEENLSNMWDKQKGYPNQEKCDNCLDQYSFS